MLPCSKTTPALAGKCSSVPALVSRPVAGSRVPAQDNSSRSQCSAQYQSTGIAPARVGRRVCVTKCVVSPERARTTGSSSVPAKLAAKSEVIQVYRYPGLSESALKTLLHKAQNKVTTAITGIDSEQCYNIGLDSPLTAKEADTMAWLLRETFEPELLTAESRYTGAPGTVVEVGPRMSFSTAFSTNGVSIAASCGLNKVNRLERSRRYYLTSTRPLTAAEVRGFAALVHDRMTEEVYSSPVTSFRVTDPPAPVFTVPVVAEGRKALERINQEMGLAFDEWDLDYYTSLFRDDMKRDPTNVELFDIAQSNSEHSRHWFFRGNLVIDGQKMPENLFNIVKTPWKVNPNNSVVAFCDNSSAIRGFQCNPLLPLQPGNPSALAPQSRDWDLLLTAETHNFPCAVAPFPGAETGAGGRMRDTHATGTGSIMGAGTAGYCTGNLNIEGAVGAWEDQSFEYPDNLASPLQILIDASNGASDYGNKFGEPLIAGYCRTFGQRLPNGERREWIKPIMFSGGVGQIDHRHLKKQEPQISMLVVKIGGPAYRIGMGGGAASSVPSGTRDGQSDLDFNAVQRGDAEMSQKLWRVVRSCVEMGDKNPIVQIHDQGAGGNCNVVKEIIYPLGAEIDVRAVKVGDDTLSVLEIWGAEYQENDCLLIKPDARDALQAICDRERCLMQVIGSIDGSGRVKLVDKSAPTGTPPAVDLDLEKVLGSMPDKTFEFKREASQLRALELPAGATAQQAIERVLRLPSVCSKRFLTNKVDRHVTGLVAQQQCVGPLQLPISDVAVFAQSHQDHTGLATSIGEQPIKGLINPAAMARLSLGEALTNLVLARATSLPDVRASVNWMYAAKMKSEGAAMYDAATAIRDAMIDLGVACDGGKDSLSMAARAGGEVVMAPGNLVVSAYVGCPDITQVVTPDLKLGDNGVLIHVDLGAGRRRLGGSALAQAYNQLGNEAPDVDTKQLKGLWEVTQALLAKGHISAGHDISDGGLATTLCEMAFAGDCGLTVDVPAPAHAADAAAGSAVAALFAEELGLVLEVVSDRAASVVEQYKKAGVTASVIGKTTSAKQISLAVAGTPAIQGPTVDLRNSWEETAFHLEKLQADEETVAQEWANQAVAKPPRWNLPYTPTWTPEEKLKSSDKVRVAIIREEGSNGDREMAAAAYAAGMEPWDITMSDLINGRASLDSFRGIIFVGGFSYADTLDSAKGWAAAIRFNERVISQFQAFYARADTWSLGVCNGCQLMALLGWVPASGAPTDKPNGVLPDLKQPRFVHNKSGRFESRWVNVTIAPDSPAIMLRGMGGANIGVWAAHGEGQALFPDEQVRQHVLSKHLAPLRYTDADGQATEQYPANPNGSPLGIAAMCSENGRHLAMMPHPERAFLTWQLPWYPKDLPLQPKGPGPWLQLFQNARIWCEEQDAKQQ